MLLGFLPVLSSSGVRIVLASGSARRVQLMSQLIPGCTQSQADKQAGVMDSAVSASTPVTFKVIPSTFPELLSHANHTPASYCLATAYEKGKEVWDRGGSDILISADTVVAHQGKILEKPQCQTIHHHKRER
jgi:predicted house-cleaning NTP pyrophosphatase (Maf/HAM1 superfamily)